MAAFIEQLCYNNKIIEAKSIVDEFDIMHLITKGDAKKKLTDLNKLGYTPIPVIQGDKPEI